MRAVVRGAQRERHLLDGAAVRNDRRAFGDLFPGVRQIDERLREHQERVVADRRDARIVGVQLVRWRNEVLWNSVRDWRSLE